MDPWKVRAAGPDDRQTVADLITIAFATDAMARFGSRNLADYLRVMPRIIDALWQRAFPQGSVDFIEGGFGAAMWLPPGVTPDSETLSTIIEETTQPDLLEDLGAMLGEMAGFHPPGPHWYLPLIGIDPFQQGKGVGSALLRHAAQRCDAGGTVAYLESTNDRNIPLYQRYGFEILGEIQVGTSPKIVPMVRQPRPPR